jgi:hypothetical protein
MRRFPAVDSLFQSGRIVDCILAIMAVETIVLILVRKQGWLRMRLPDLLVNIGAGAALLLALRTALRGGGWQAMALWLLIALAFHAGELTLRWSMRRTP